MNQTVKVYPVSVINRYVKTLLDRDEALSDVWVSGELSNFKRHSSGHLYFTLKDNDAAINAVMFASDARRLRFYPENGAKVRVRGSVTLFERTGGYQLYVRQMEPAGTGDLYQAFEQLKQKLAAEGLFDEARKKPLPFFPRKIGIVTSSTGAAVRDIIQIAKRRYPGVSLVLYPALVQGPDAAPTIVAGIRALDAIPEVEVIIIGRGGGSMEDLWPFNEESVARAMAAAATPIISAVGHETDFTIADFVSDKRASTPSAAAELAVPECRVLGESVRKLSSEMNRQMVRAMDRLRSELAFQEARLEHLSPSSRIREARQQVELSSEERERRIRIRLDREQQRLERLTDRLRLSSPLFPLEKGYAMISGDDGKVIGGIGGLTPGKRIIVRVKDGSAAAVVDKTIEDTSNE